MGECAEDVEPILDGCKRLNGASGLVPSPHRPCTCSSRRVLGNWPWRIILVGASNAGTCTGRRWPRERTRTSWANAIPLHRRYTPPHGRASQAAVVRIPPPCACRAAVDTRMQAECIVLAWTSKTSPCDRQITAGRRCRGSERMRCGSGERVRTSLYSSPPVRVCVVEVRDVANGRRGSLLCSRDVEQGG